MTSPSYYSLLHLKPFTHLTSSSRNQLRASLQNICFVFRRNSSGHGSPCHVSVQHICGSLRGKAVDLHRRFPPDTCPSAVFVSSCEMRARLCDSITASRYGQSVSTILMKWVWWRVMSWTVSVLDVMEGLFHMCVKVHSQTWFKL